MSKKLTPRKIVEELSKYIIGQDKAKRTVALALRWRWRRMRVEKSLRDEIMPKNILMIGPTGVGKTEISRRLARLTNAPFIKVEATKFTEIGYVGRDVDSIIRDLLEVAIDSARDEYSEKVQQRAEERAEERILDALLPDVDKEETADTRDKLLQQFRAGDLDNREIEIETSNMSQVEILSPPGLEEITSQFQSMLQTMGKERKKTRRMPVNEAFEVCVEEEVQEMIDMNEVKDIAIERVEENGIVFIDEMDKIAENGGRNGGDISRHGVQRDLLPLVEGTTVSTKHGNVRTDHILFIASGAFHLSRPSDLIPELQGRFPLRVELSSLTVSDFRQILTNTKACLIRQYQALLKTEKVTLTFEEEAIDAIAQLAWQVNENNENIGARRLYTIMEKLLEDCSFEADQMGGKTVNVDAAMVREVLKDLSESSERVRYVL